MLPEFVSYYIVSPTTAMAYFGNCLPEMITILLTSISTMGAKMRMGRENGGE